jgi:NADH dehydrogenase/NADH:ubiquinone oxidoreductase subunit G
MAEEQMQIFIDDIPVQANKGDTILSAAKRAGKYIPTLCY